MDNSLESQAKWYVLHTYSGYEAMVKASLERLIENNNLKDSIFDLRIPMEQTIEEKSGKRKVVERKLLPCYVFIKMIYSNQVWYLVTNTRGVTGFVGPQGRPLPLKERRSAQNATRNGGDQRGFRGGRRRQHRRGPAFGICGQDQGTQRHGAEGEGQRHDVRPQHRRGSGVRPDPQNKSHGNYERVRGDPFFLKSGRSANM